MRLNFTTCLAENSVPISNALVDHLSTSGLSLNFAEHVSYQERLAGILSGDIALSWICGLLYSKLKEQNDNLAAVAAPIFSYTHDSSAVYYSYMIVKKSSSVYSFNDLANCRLAINERSSFSGYDVLRHYFAQTGLKPFFRETLLSGSHQQSLEMLVTDKADTAAIDHTLFHYWQKQQPEASKNVRIVKTLGPFPMPPLVINQKLDSSTKAKLSSALLTLPKDLLHSLDLKAIQAVDDSYYDPIRQAARLAARIIL